MSNPDANLAFRAAVEARDAAAVRDCLAPDVRFYSPLRFTPFVGRDEVAAILQIPAAVFAFHDSFRYTRVFDGGDDQQALFFEAMIEDRQIEGVDLLRLDNNGLVTEIRVMMRPLAMIQRFADSAAEMLTRAHRAQTSSSADQPASADCPPASTPSTNTSLGAATRHLSSS